MRQKKFRIKLFGEVFDSSSLSALGVQTIGQLRLSTAAPGCFILEVSEFDEKHIKFRLHRNLKKPQDLKVLDKPNEVLQHDQLAIFPELPTFPSFGGYCIVTTTTDNLVDQINDSRKAYRGSELSGMSIQTTPDYLDVAITKK